MRRDLQDEIYELWDDTDAVTFDNVLAVFADLFDMQPLPTLRALQVAWTADEDPDPSLKPLLSLIERSQSNPPRAIASMIRIYELKEQHGDASND